jgi:hypothetical protein
LDPERLNIPENLDELVAAGKAEYIVLSDVEEDEPHVSDWTIDLKIVTAPFPVSRTEKSDKKWNESTNYAGLLRLPETVFRSKDSKTLGASQPILE